MGSIGWSRKSGSERVGLGGVACSRAACSIDVRRPNRLVIEAAASIGTADNGCADGDDRGSRQLPKHLLERLQGAPQG